MLYTALDWIIRTVWYGGSLFAIAKGDWMARSVGVLFVVSNISALFVDVGMRGLERLWLLLALKLIVLAVLATFAWKSPRSWPLWATAFQAISVTLKIGELLDLKISPFASATANNLSAYGQIATLVLGTWYIWREREALKPIKDVRSVL